MNKIISTTDFSKTASHALQYAVMLAKQQKTPIELELLNVYHISAALSSIISEQHIQKLSRHQLFDITLYNHLNDLPTHVHLNGTITEGPVAKTIIKKAKDKKVDMIVMGRNGASGLTEWLLGSTTKKVINDTEIPVLVIPQYAKISAPKRIALAIDDRFVPNDATLAPLFELVDTFNTELVLFHVEQDEAHSNTHKETAIKIARKGYQINLFKKTSTNIAEALVELSAENDIDLLCLIRHDYSAWDKMLHKSASLEIGKKSPLPFLILHDTNR